MRAPFRATPSGSTCPRLEVRGRSIGCDSPARDRGNLQKAIYQIFRTIFGPTERSPWLVRFRRLTQGGIEAVYLLEREQSVIRDCACQKIRGEEAVRYLLPSAYRHWDGGRCGHASGGSTSPVFPVFSVHFLSLGPGAAVFSSPCLRRAAVASALDVQAHLLHACFAACGMVTASFPAGDGLGKMRMRGPDLLSSQ